MVLAKNEPKDEEAVALNSGKRNKQSPFLSEKYVF